MSDLGLDDILEILNEPDAPQKFRFYAPPEQKGPLRWRDKDMRCASKGCSSPTTCQVKGIPYCMMHSLRKLNEMLVELGVAE